MKRLFCHQPKDALIIRLDKDNKVSYDDTSYAVLIDSVLKVYQNVENVPEEVTNQLSTLNEALEGEDIEKAENYLANSKMF